MLSVPSSGVQRKLQLRSRKKGLRSNEIFTMERSEKKAVEDLYHLRRFYSLRTADNRCVEVDSNGYLVTAKVNTLS